MRTQTTEERAKALPPVEEWEARIDEVVAIMADVVAYIANDSTTSASYYVSFESVEAITGAPEGFVARHAEAIASKALYEENLCECYAYEDEFDCTTWWCEALEDVPLRMWSQERFDSLVEDCWFDDDLLGSAVAQAVEDEAVGYEEGKWVLRVEEAKAEDEKRLCDLLNAIGFTKERMFNGFNVYYLPELEEEVEA